MIDEAFQYAALMANHISRMKTYPFLDGIHYLRMCLLFRQGDEENVFSKRFIFGSWCLNILMCFSGSVVSNFLAGEPISTPFKYQDNLIIATVIWYLINFFPKDLIHRFFKVSIIEIILTCMWNVYLVNKIQSGVSYGIKHFPDAYIIAIVLGMAKGCGDSYMYPVVKTLKGSYVREDNVILYSTDQIKCSLLSSMALVFSHYYHLPGYSQPFVFLACLLLFIHATMSKMAFETASIFAPLENILCAILFKWNVNSSDESKDDHLIKNFKVFGPKHMKNQDSYSSIPQNDDFVKQ